MTDELAARWFTVMLDPSTDPLARPLEERVRERRERLVDRRLDQPSPATRAWAALGKSGRKTISRLVWDRLQVPEADRARPTPEQMVAHSLLKWRVMHEVAASG